MNKSKKNDFSFVKSTLCKQDEIMSAVKDEYSDEVTVFRVKRDPEIDICALNCSVCLQSDPNLSPITETDTDNYSALFKLRTCVPEIEWKETYMICPPCDIDLDLVYKFREKCLNSETLRNQPPPPFPKSPTPPPVPKIKTKPKKPHQFKCDQCNETFRTSTQLVNHSIKQHQTKILKPYSCHLCDRKFSNSTNLDQHLKYHKGERTYVCTYCGKGFITYNDLNIHEKIHLNKRDYKCEICSKSFNTHKTLRTHKIVVHTDPKMWNHVCGICSKRFPMKSNYDAHVRRHNNERPFGCHLCEKKFIDKCVLQKHFLSHTNNRNHMCEICKKEYKDKRIMALHQRKVHGIGDIKIPEKVKKHLCHLCPKAYFAKNKLTRHLYTHTGERPYFCNICQKKFIDKSYVKQHMKKAHNIVAAEET